MQTSIVGRDSAAAIAASATRARAWLGASDVIPLDGVGPSVTREACVVVIAA
jgi:hypothetical protein